MKQLTLLSFQFYRIVLLYNTAFTLTVLCIMILNGVAIDAGSFLFAKLVGVSSAIALHNYSYKQSYFYFRNSGYYMRQIFAATFALDISVYIIITLSGSIVFKVWQY